jgi:signal transduction histidine kinase
VEVAAYRIATEALTNAARHARARTTCVDLSVEAEALRLEVVDDGVGLDVARGRGVGLTAMSERAAELGGTCSVVPRSRGGTAVLALLPIREAS